MVIGPVRAEAHPPPSGPPGTVAASRQPRWETARTAERVALPQDAPHKERPPASHCSSTCFRGDRNESTSKTVRMNAPLDLVNWSSL